MEDAVADAVAGGVEGAGDVGGGVFGGFGEGGEDFGEKIGVVAAAGFEDQFLGGGALDGLSVWLFGERL